MLMITCEIQVVNTQNGYVFTMPAVVFTPSSMTALEQRRLMTTTVDIVQPNLTSSRSELIFIHHAEFPVSNQTSQIIIRR